MEFALYIIRTKRGSNMKRQIFLGIGLLVILLPFVTPSSPIAVTDGLVNPPSTPEINAVTSGQKLFYNISEFQYGDGIWDLLDDLLAQVGGPAFDKGIIGSLEGSEIVTYLSNVGNIFLYQWNEPTAGYVNQTLTEAMEIFSFIQLNEELGVHINASQFSFPDDFAEDNITDFRDYWPWGDFDDPVDPEFWNGFNASFVTTFYQGFDDHNISMTYDNWYPYPHEDWYGHDDLYWYGWDLGLAVGYDIGHSASYESGGSPAWYDANLALNGYYAGFNAGKDAGFAAGQADFLADKIPDKRYFGALPAYAGVDDLAYGWDYHRAYEMWYQEGFLYQGALVYFNRELYRDLYDAEWDSYWNGYVEGFRDHYWTGRDHGSFDMLGPYPGPNYYPPELTWEPYDDRDHGYVDGMYVGYDFGYDDGYYGYTVGENYMHGLENYKYHAYYDGFANGTIDKLASSPYNEVPVNLPFSPSTVDPYEQGANFIYENMYREGYSNGYLYATLVSSPDPLNWLWSNGPFYHMTLPDFEFTLAAGSIAPTPLMDFTMLTDLNMLFPDDQGWEFNWGAHDYWPYEDKIVPMQSFYAGTTDWVKLDTFSQELNTTEDYERVGVNTTYDIANEYFEIEMVMNATGPGIYQNVVWGYNTSTGMLLNVTMDVDFYEQTDVWANITLEYLPGKTVDVTPTMPSPTSWTYLINNFVFYFDLPPASDPDFVDGITEFKTNGLNSIGNPLLGVDMVGYHGLWAEADFDLYDPANTSKPAELLEGYKWPMFSPAGPVWNANDWELYDGLWTTVSSVVGITPYLQSALNALALQNTNVDLTSLILTVGVDKYYYAASDINYYYVTFDIDLDFGWSMLNGEYIWETITEDGWVRGSIWVGVDATTGVVLGAGGKASFEFEITQVPNYGMNGGILNAYIEMSIGTTLKTVPDLYTLIGGLPAVNEFGIVSILSIIGLAAVASAVIFTKKR
jgi:hypothetical protein